MMKALIKWPTPLYVLLRAIRSLVSLFFIVLIPTETLAAGAKGTDFWFAFPQGNTLVSQSSSASVGVIISGTPNASFSLTVPGSGPQTFSFDSNGYYKWTGTISSTSDTFQTSGIDAVGSRFVNISAGAPVSVQVAYEDTSGPTSVAYWQAIPTDALGKEYYVLAYGNSASTNSSEGTEFVIVATANGTTVTINPTASIGTRASGSSYQISLNQGQTYFAKNVSANADLSGTLITANQPIAVISGHSCALIPITSSVCSTVFEELFPTTGWSRNFILSPFAAIPPGTNGDRIRIVANSNGTVVNINSTSTVNLDRGGLYETNLTASSSNPDPTVITSNFPIMVAQFAKDSTDYQTTNREEPSMLLVPGYDHYVTGATFNLPRNGYDNYLNLVAPTSQLSSMTLDNTSISTYFSPVGSTGYSRAIIQVDGGTFTGGTTGGSHTLTANLPFGVMAYGFGKANSARNGFGSIPAFNMPSIAQASSVSISPTTSGKYILGTRVCHTATLLSSAGLPVTDASVTWTATGVNPSTTNQSTDGSGSATYCYQGTTVGTDTLVAKASASNVSSSTVSVQWINVSALDLVGDGKGSTLINTSRCLKATVRDNLGNPVSGSTVIFTVTGPNARTGSGVSDASGVSEYCYAGSTVGQDSVVASVSGVGVQSSAVSLQWINISAIDLVGDGKGSSLINTSRCLKATVKDTLGKPVSGSTVIFTVTGPNARTGSVNTDANGTSEYCYTATAVGQDAVVASVSGVGVQSSAVSLQWIKVSTLDLVGDGKGSTLINTSRCLKATVKDTQGNPVSGSTVIFTVTGPNARTGSGVSDASGVSEYCYAGSTVGQDSVVASVSGVGVQSSAVSLQWINISALDLVGDGKGSSVINSSRCLRATVRDNLGNPVSGSTVIFTVTGPNAQTGSGISNPDGRAEYCYLGNSVGQDAIVASVNLVLSPRVTIDWILPLDKISLTSSVVQTKVGNQICVSAYASNMLGQGFANAEINFVVRGANALNGSRLTSDNGLAEFCYLPGSPGTDQITAVSGSIPSASTLTVSVSSNPVCDVVSTSAKSSFLRDTLQNCLVSYAKSPNLSAYDACQSNANTALITSIQANNTSAGCLASNGTVDKVNQLLSVLDPLIGPILQDEPESIKVFGRAKGARRYNSIAIQLAKTMNACFSSGGAFDQSRVTNTFESLFSLSGKSVLSVSAPIYTQAIRQSCSTIVNFQN